MNSIANSEGMTGIELMLTEKGWQTDDGRCLKGAGGPCDIIDSGEIQRTSPTMVASGRIAVILNMLD